MCFGVAPELLADLLGHVDTRMVFRQSGIQLRRPSTSGPTTSTAPSKPEVGCLLGSQWGPKWLFADAALAVGDSTVDSGIRLFLLAFPGTPGDIARH